MGVQDLCLDLRFSSPVPTLSFVYSCLSIVIWLRPGTSAGLGIHRTHVPRASAALCGAPAARQASSIAEAAALALPVGAAASAAA